MNELMDSQPSSGLPERQRVLLIVLEGGQKCKALSRLIGLRTGMWVHWSREIEMDCESRTEGWEGLADNSQKPRGKAFSPTAPFLLKKKKGGLLLIESPLPIARSWATCYIKPLWLKLHRTFLSWRLRRADHFITNSTKQDSFLKPRKVPLPLVAGLWIGTEWFVKEGSWNQRSESPEGHKTVVTSQLSQAYCSLHLLISGITKTRRQKFHPTRYWQRSDLMQCFWHQSHVSLLTYNT